MKPQVDFIIPCNNQEGEMVLNFRNVEEIESVIDSLEECRAELEHQIEMERQRKREKKMRKRMREKQWIEQQEKELEEKAGQFIDYLNLHEKIADLLNGIRKDSQEEKELKHILNESLYNITKSMYDSMDEKTKKILKPLIDEFDKIYKSQSGWYSSSRK